MSIHNVTASDSLTVSETVTASVRYSFTAQFLWASVLFAKRAKEIEDANPSTPDEPTRTEHRGLITAAIMQSVAAVEAESAEIALHGPGHHLGSNGILVDMWNFLKPLADIIDDQDVLTRYSMMLHLLKKEPFDAGVQPCQDMATLVRLRNELVHYKSRWGEELDRMKFFRTLLALRLNKPPFVDNNQNFFPHHILGADCTKWAARTAIAFINAFYAKIGVESVLLAQGDRLRTD